MNCDTLKESEVLGARLQLALDTKLGGTYLLYPCLELRLGRQRRDQVMATRLTILHVCIQLVLV